MAKKRKKSKSKDQIPLIVFTPEALQVDTNEPDSLLAKIESFISAEPGWKAVFAPCHSCDTPASSLPVVFWAFVRWENGVSDVCGLVHGLDGFFFYPQTDHTFIGYVGPGQQPEELISRLFDINEE